MVWYPALHGTIVVAPDVQAGNDAGGGRCGRRRGVTPDKSSIHTMRLKPFMTRTDPGFHTPKAVTYHEPTVVWLFMIGHSLGRMEACFSPSAYSYCNGAR